jgi:MerR family transcriptional regulator/heat shock protein HspR
VRPRGVYISQVARMLGVSPWVLRAWENEGLIAPARTASGYRVFAPDDLDRLRRIRDLIGEGLNPAGVRRVLDADGRTGEDRPGRRRPRCTIESGCCASARASRCAGWPPWPA